MDTTKNVQTQTVTCQYNADAIGEWYPEPIACEPIKCQKLPDIPEGAYQTFNHLPDPISKLEHKTNVTYSCHEDQFAFDYPVDPNMISFSQTTNIKEVTIVCDGNG